MGCNIEPEVESNIFIYQNETKELNIYKKLR